MYVRSVLILILYINSVLGQDDCEMPDFQRASFGVVEVSPTGVFLRVEVKPLETTKNGFTVAIVFPELVFIIIEFN